MVLKVKGTVGKGLGSSAKWMPDYISWLYPGTLNVILEEKCPAIKWHTEIKTHWRKPIKLANCLINGIEATIILPPLANTKKRPNLLEVGATVKLRDELKLSTGDTVEIILV